MLFFLGLHDGNHGGYIVFRDFRTFSSSFLLCLSFLTLYAFLLTLSLPFFSHPLCLSLLFYSIKGVNTRALFPIDWVSIIFGFVFRAASVCLGYVINSAEHEVYSHIVCYTINCNYVPISALQNIDYSIRYAKNQPQSNGDTGRIKNYWILYKLSHSIFITCFCLHAKRQITKIVPYK